VYYEDELALTEYLLDKLERQLAGRDDKRVVNRLPVDHCLLGVLFPCGDSRANAGGSDSPANGEKLAEPRAADDERGSQCNGNLSETQGLAQFSRQRPSSIGFELLVQPSEDRMVHLSVSAEFTIYTRHLPTYAEQMSVSKAESSTEDPLTGETPLAEVVERHRIRTRPVEMRLHVKDGLPQHARHWITLPLRRVLDECATRKDSWLDFKRKPNVPHSALSDEAGFLRFVEDLVGKYDRADDPPIQAALDVRLLPWGYAAGNARLYRVGCYLSNLTPTPERAYMTDYLIMGDAIVEGELLSGSLRPIETVSVPRDYQYDRRVWAVGHNASVASLGSNRFATRALARYRQVRRATANHPSAKFEALREDPVASLESIRQSMEGYIGEWQENVVEANSLGLTPEQLRQAKRDLDYFKKEANRLGAGIAALCIDERLLKAFQATHRVFERVAANRYDAWRLFQIVFMASQLPALAAREGLFEGEWPPGKRHCWADELEWADVIWFPTGGGKTEAYLGLITCAMLYDRLRGKDFGVTAWIRFPLRMLSVQQLQRALKVVWEAEKERRELVGDNGSDSFALGYFVGSSPDLNNREDLERADSDKLKMINRCPECGSVVAIIKDEERLRVVHSCPRCGELPLYVTNHEIYRYLPSLIVGTVDKIATVAYQRRFSLLWGGAQSKCPDHGYTMGNYCSVYGCRARRQRVRPYDGAPSLHVQDELHLLQEELGAFAGHYETLLTYCERNLTGNRAKRIAATATIEGFERQVQHLYGSVGVRRFPERGYDRHNSFYAKVDNLEASGPPKIARLYVGFRPAGGRSEDISARCTAILLDEIRRLYEKPSEAFRVLRKARSEEEVRKVLFYYTTALNYVKNLSSGARIRDALQRSPSPGNGYREINAEFHSSRSTLAELAALIERLETPPDYWEEDFLDVVVATDIISHGVDVERINMMIIDRIPEEVAEYIQVSSRSGRSHVGLVITVLPPYSLRASSIYHRFEQFHDHIDRLVAPVPVNRFAKYVIDRTSPGLLVGLLFGLYNPTEEGCELHKRHKAEAFLSVRASKVLEALRGALALDAKMYPYRLVATLSETIGNRFAALAYSIRASDEAFTFKAIKPEPMRSLRDVEERVPLVLGPSWADIAWWISRASRTRRRG